MPTLSANGLDVRYTVEGEGPPLVLLHAATSSALEDWGAQRPFLRRSFRLFLPDARGHAGTRADVEARWSRDDLVADLLAFADGLGLDTFHVAGLSMGAMTALAFATRQPERLRSAIVASIDVQRQPRASVAARLMDPERIEREDPVWAAALARRHDPVQGEGAWKRLLRRIRDDIGAQPELTPAELRRARLPILLVVGDRDPWVPLDHAVALKRQLPDARLLVCPGSGHVVTTEQAALFNQAAGAFLQRVEAARDAG
jgi:pimeloyl-ACP methyl ester carboxylesterase